MRASFLSALQHARRRPLATCAASFFTLSGPAIAGANLPVNSCLDDGIGQTLRVVVGAAASGDTVDLTGLSGPSACSGSQISLLTGQIAVAQDDLTIKGPGSATLAINGSYLPTTPGVDSRLFKHTGGGTLTFQDVGLKNGHIDNDSSSAALGACVYSAGNLELYGTDVASCSGYSQDGDARGGALLAYGTIKLHGSTITKGESQSGNSFAQGGAIWTKGNVVLDHSNVSGNTTTAGGTAAYGGGIAAGGDLTLTYATLSDNTAKSPAKGSRGGGAAVFGRFDGEYSTVAGNSAQGDSSATYGGGIYATGSVACRHCSVSGNHSDGPGGGLAALASAPNSNSLELRSSTISGNTSGAFTGGVLTDATSVALYNTTVVLNTADIAKANNYIFAPGLALSAVPAGVQATLQSSLLSNNVYGGTAEDDVSAATTILHPVTFNVGPANNFVRTYSAGNLPNDTLVKSCPLLGPLRNNGGPTLTHALLSTSVAIDAGNNVLSEAEDQRGVPLDDKPLPYPRESPSGKPDIGAYEVDQDEIVFDASFDGCVDL